MSKIYQKFVRRMIFPFLDVISGSSLSATLQQIKSFKSFKREDIIKFQTSNLRLMLEYCYNNVPYYHKLFSELGFTEFQSSSISDLSKIPPLTKSLIRENFEDLTSNLKQDINHKYSSTGGSTGDPLIFLLDMKSWSYSWNYLFKYWSFVDYTIGDKVMMLGSSSLYNTKKRSKEQWLLHKIFRLYPFPGMNMSDVVCKKYLEILMNKRIRYLYGYASSIFTLAKYALKNDININLRGVMPTSEICPPYYKDAYKRAFGCKVVDGYGARDGNISAFECEKQNFHLCETSIVRTLSDSNPGKIYITDLTNFAMPFINYEIGDVMNLSQDECSCGRSQFIAKEIIGREQNIIEFPNGRIITGPGWTVLFQYKNVESFRISKSGGTKLTVEIVPLANYDKINEENEIRDSLQKFIGKENEIEFIYKDKMTVSLSGKAAYFIGDT